MTVFLVLGSLFFGLAVSRSRGDHRRRLQLDPAGHLPRLALAFLGAQAVDAINRRTRIGRPKAIALVYFAAPFVGS
jgi:hypothetical protein